jgi:hypothetical protein
MLRKHPVRVGISIGGLAVAIGVETSVFSLVNAAGLGATECRASPVS